MCIFTKIKEMNLTLDKMLSRIIFMTSLMLPCITQAQIHEIDLSSHNITAGMYDLTVSLASTNANDMVRAKFGSASILLYTPGAGSNVYQDVAIRGIHLPDNFESFTLEPLPGTNGVQISTNNFSVTRKERYEGNSHTVQLPGSNCGYVSSWEWRENQLYGEDSMSQAFYENGDAYLMTNAFGYSTMYCSFPLGSLMRPGELTESGFTIDAIRISAQSREGAQDSIGLGCYFDYGINEQSTLGPILHSVDFAGNGIAETKTLVANNPFYNRVFGGNQTGSDARAPSAYCIIANFLSQDNDLHIKGLEVDITHLTPPASTTSAPSASGSMASWLHKLPGSVCMPGYALDIWQNSPYGGSDAGLYIQHAASSFSILDKIICPIPSTSLFPAVGTTSTPFEFSTLDVILENPNPFPAQPNVEKAASCQALAHDGDSMFEGDLVTELDAEPFSIDLQRLSLLGANGDINWTRTQGTLATPSSNAKLSVRCTGPEDLKVIMLKARRCRESGCVEPPENLYTQPGALAKVVVTANECRGADQDWWLTERYKDGRAIGPELHDNIARKIVCPIVLPADDTLEHPRLFIKGRLHVESPNDRGTGDYDRICGLAFTYKNGTTEPFASNYPDSEDWDEDLLVGSFWYGYPGSEAELHPSPISSSGNAPEVGLVLTCDLRNSARFTSAEIWVSTSMPPADYQPPAN